MDGVRHKLIIPTPCADESPRLECFYFMGHLSSYRIIWVTYLEIDELHKQKKTKNESLNLVGVRVRAHDFCHSLNFIE